VTAFGDVGVSTNYESIASTSANTYNTSTGAVGAIYSTVAGVTVIFDVFSLKQIDGVNIKPSDKKALVPAKSISAVTPSIEDRVMVAGVPWRVVNVNTDPAEALWELQVRKT
tara:strand:+ start:186 stop:521 length:336 start_codon:yes stop_codon:yes gene_type:complete